MFNKLSDEEKHKELEKQILLLSDMNIEKEIGIHDIKIDYLGDNYIHTIQTGHKNKNKLLLLHGYGGSSILYYKMLKPLSEIYEVFCIDLLGMGLSSRPEIQFSSTDDTINFFVDSIEQWRISMGIDNFELGGHSFGGYIASQYTFKYSDRVSKLYLISPLGFTQADSTEFNDEEYLAAIKNYPFFTRQIKKLKLKMLNNMMTPSEFVNKNDWWFGCIGRRIVKNRLKVENHIADMLYEFLYYNWKKEKNSEKALFYIINKNVHSYVSIEAHIKDLKIPVEVYFGEYDWMDDVGARRLREAELDNYKLVYIKDSGHQITMENALGLVEEMIKDKESIFNFDY